MDGITTDHHLVLLCAADDKFAMPMQVMLSSVLSRLHSATRIRVFVINGGITAANMVRVKSSLMSLAPNLEFQWLKPDFKMFVGLDAGSILSMNTYLRLQLGTLLPRDVLRAIYLDCDVVVQTDLTQLWEIDLQDAIVGGARDYCFPRVSSPGGVTHWRKLGIGPELPYVNAGVLLIDVAKWREQLIAERILAYLNDASMENRLADQGGINAILAGQIKLVDPRWNVTLSSLALYDDSIQGQAIETIREDPWIIHFTSRWKPWHYGIQSWGALRAFYYDQKYRNIFFEAYLRSGWQSTRRAYLWVLVRQLALVICFKAPNRLLQRLNIRI